MSGEMAIRAALVTALKAAGADGAPWNGVYDGAPPAGASAPRLVVGESVAADWGGKALEGVEMRIAVVATDPGADCARMTAMRDAVELVVRGLESAGDGWRLASIVLVRSRVTRAKGAGEWIAASEYRLRAWRESG